MGDTMVIDVPETTTQGVHANRSSKRKRTDPLSDEERETRARALREEVDSLLKYYGDEFLVGEKKLGFDLEGCDGNAVIACLLEESSLPLSKLVGEIWEKLQGKEGFTLASVKSSVLLVGQRSFYGLPNHDVDVLEDDTSSCLWCWETRDLKLIPKSMRTALKIRRTCRRKIHERITAVSALLTEILKSENNANNRQSATKASERLCKVLNEAEIRSLVASMLQKSGVELAEKEVKREEKQLLKQLERCKLEAEKKKKRMERELQKEKLLSEREQKRLQDEAEKEERRREKEEYEMRKQMKRQQEKAQKGQRSREREEAELKKQLTLQKQASLMERFLKKSKDKLSSENHQSFTNSSTTDVSTERKETMLQSVSQKMDSAFSQNDCSINVEEIRRLHLSCWHSLSHSVDRKHHWGTRLKPKTAVVKELKLTASEGLSGDHVTLEKLVDGWIETKADDRSCTTDADISVPSSQKCNRSKKLLQFEKSHRPAFYGFWPKKSQVVGPRRPLIKDPDLDYEIDSDEEWEEEEPGESLSNCDKDDDEKSIEEGLSKADEEDENEDGFFVPDGYLSENEGVDVEKMVFEGERSSPIRKQDDECEELRVLLQQQKILHNLTELALRKNRPLIITNVTHKKSHSFSGGSLISSSELELICLQALSVRAFPWGQFIEISVASYAQEEDPEDSHDSGTGSTAPLANGTALLDSDLPQIVSVIQSCPQNINKILKSLHQKFPSVAKSLLRNKVRDISSFSYSDNRWQVKKDILDKLGLSSSPDKSCGKTKSIATFFSKRCLPPCKNIDPDETSPQSSEKSIPVNEPPRGNGLQ